MHAPGYTDYALLDAPAARRRLGDRFAGWLTWVLLGYALLGRAFAYVGVAPLFIGEITLLFGGVALMASRSVLPVLRLWPGRLLPVLMVWGLACTVPHVGTYGFDALRDAALWAYGLYALALAAVLIQDPERLRFVLVRYRGFVSVFIGLIWLVFLLYQMYASVLPKMPGSHAPILAAKGGDILVHLAGVTAFILVGMARPKLPLLLLLALSLGITVVANRGGMVAFSLATLVALWLRPPHVKLGRIVYGGLLLVVVLGLVDPEYRIDGNRTVSMESLWTNVMSIFGETDASHLEGTKEWRLLWWEKIVGYTFGGDYFLMGKGFGVNLAESDGFEVNDSALRSPHNGHMSFLARSGVPGFFIWLALQLTWGLSVFFRCLEARRAGDHAWTGIFTFILAYWIAAIANASFDVYLEGPMGGIWFWCIFGAGLAALHVHRHHPEVAWD